MANSILNKKFDLFSKLDKTPPDDSVKQTDLQALCRYHDLDRSVVLSGDLRSLAEIDVVYYVGSHGTAFRIDENHVLLVLKADDELLKSVTVGRKPSFSSKEIVFLRTTFKLPLFAWYNDSQFEFKKYFKNLKLRNHTYLYNPFGMFSTADIAGLNNYDGTVHGLRQKDTNVYLFKDEYDKRLLLMPYMIALPQLRDYDFDLTKFYVHNIGPVFSKVITDSIAMAPKLKKIFRLQNSLIQVAHDQKEIYPSKFFDIDAIYNPFTNVEVKRHPKYGVYQIMFSRAPGTVKITRYYYDISFVPNTTQRNFRPTGSNKKLEEEFCYLFVNDDKYYSVMNMIQSRVVMQYLYLFSSIGYDKIMVPSGYEKGIVSVPSWTASIQPVPGVLDNKDILSEIVKYMTIVDIVMFSQVSVLFRYVASKAAIWELNLTWMRERFRWDGEFPNALKDKNKMIQAIEAAKLIATCHQQRSQWTIQRIFLGDHDCSLTLNKQLKDPTRSKKNHKKI